MLPLKRGRYVARLAESPADIQAAQGLRHLAFRAAQGEPSGLDSDRFDAVSRHVLVEDAGHGSLLCCFRLLPLEGGAGIGQSYAAQFYDLDGLSQFEAPMMELGRFCVHPEAKDPDILRLSWAAITRMVDSLGVEMLFGCSSFPGADAARHTEALALLKERHLGPERWLPRVKATNFFRYAQTLGSHQADPDRALARMPPLLRTYLMMGGWVSDHAVLDHDLDTLHVFTALEIRAIPPARLRSLRALAD